MEHTPALHRSPWRWLPYSLIGLALVAFLGYFVIYNLYAVALFQFPFDYDQGEGYELLDTVLFSQGEWPYRDSNEYPFYSSNYPPVFHLATVPLVWLFGPQYWTGRLVSYLGTLINALAIGYAVANSSAVGRTGRRWWLSLLCGLGFLASNYVYHVGPLFRQHMFMVMFETLAVVLLTMVVEREEASGRRNNRGLVVVLLLLLLAGYTKQLAYATVVAVFIFLALRQLKRAILWAIPFALITGLIFLWINVATDGQWYINSIAANLNEFIPSQAIGLYRQWFGLHIVITIVAALYAVYQLYFERLSLYSIWFVVAVINSVTAGTWGAGESYFATAIAASLILTGLACSRLLNWLAARDNARPLGSYAAALTLIPLLFLFQADRLFHMPTHTPFLARVAETLGRPSATVVPPRQAVRPPAHRPPSPTSTPLASLS